MTMTPAARWGAIAGCLVLAGAGSAGAILWQASTFDANFADIQKKLTDEGARQGFIVVVEETGRDWRSRDLSVRFGGPGVDMRWTGKATFGFGTSAMLTLDTAYGTAAQFEELGIVGYSDKITLESALASADLKWSWETVPFKIMEDKVILADVGAMSLTGTGDMTAANFKLDGLMVGDKAEKLVVNTLTADFKADVEDMRNSSVSWKIASFNYEGGEEKVALGESTLTMGIRVTGEQKQTDQDGRKVPSAIFSLDYGMKLGAMDEAGVRLWDEWEARAEVNEIPEKLLTSLAFHQPEDRFGVLAYLQYAFHRQGLNINLPVNVWRLQGAEASVTGKLVDTDTGLGFFEVKIDSAFADNVPELKQETDIWVKEGLLREEEGRLVGHGIIDSQARFFMNGKPL